MSTRRLLYLAPVLLFAGLVAYLAYALRPERDPSAVPSAMIDKPAPEFDLQPLLAGLPGIATGDLGGRPVLVNFFASWCVPCRAEHPLLMRLAEEGEVALYGIAYKDRPEDAAAFLAELGNPFSRVGVDSSGRTAIDFGVYGVPESYLIDAEGRIRFRHVGPLYAHVLDEQLLPLVAGLAAQ